MKNYLKTLLVICVLFGLTACSEPEVVPIVPIEEPTVDVVEYNYDITEDETEDKTEDEVEDDTDENVIYGVRLAPLLPRIQLYDEYLDDWTCPFEGTSLEGAYVRMNPWAEEDEPGYGVYVHWGAMFPTFKQCNGCWSLYDYPWEPYCSDCGPVHVCGTCWVIIYPPELIRDECECPEEEVYDE